MKYFTLIAFLMFSQVQAQTFTKTEQSIVKGFGAGWKKADAQNAYIGILNNLVKFTGNVNSERNYFYAEQFMLNRSEPFTVSCDATVQVIGTNNNYGIVIGEPGNQYAGCYIFCVTANGQYAIEEFTRKGFITKKNARSNSAIKFDKAAVNSLKVTYNTSEKNAAGFYSFFCNNILLDTIKNYLRSREVLGVFHKADGEVHFTNFNLVQEKYNAVDKKTSLKDGMASIENAAAVGFWPFKKSALSSSQFENGFLLEGASSKLTDYNLVYSYGPYTIKEEAENKRNEIVNEIRNIRKTYLPDYRKPGTIYISKNIKDGYLAPHIYVYDVKKGEQFFTNLEFVPTKNLLQYNFINQAGKTSSNFAKSFLKVWEAAAVATPFESFKGELLQPNNRYILKSTYSIDETNNNTIETGSGLSGVYYKAEIATAMDKETALNTHSTWFIKLKDILGKAYAYSEKLYDSRGYLEEKNITFTKVLPVMGPEKNIEAQLLIQLDTKTGLYNCKLQIVSFPL